MEYINIVCCHGYNQNDGIIKKQVDVLLSTYIESNLRYVKIVYPLGPYKIGQTDVYKGWWYLESPEMYTVSQRYINAINSLDQIAKECNKTFTSNGINILMGFCQGAVASLLLVGNFYENLENKPDLLILIAPSDIMDNDWMLHKFNIPTLIIYGRKDAYLRSNFDPNFLSKYCDNYTIYTHDRGHIIPSDMSTRYFINDWINNQGIIKDISWLHVSTSRFVMIDDVNSLQIDPI